MYTSFTDWNAVLEHSGIPGMKRGVRRFQNPDGSLTPAGRARYGVMGEVGYRNRRSSARSMQRHLNKLDKGYANVAARESVHGYKAQRLIRKAVAAGMKGNTAKAEKLKNRSLKQAHKADTARSARSGIENLQWRIMQKAASQGYNVRSTAKRRMGMTGAHKTAAVLGGVTGSLGYNALRRGRGVVMVNGQKFKVSKKGNGTVRIANPAFNRQQATFGDHVSRGATKAMTEIERRKRMARSRRH